MTIQSVVKMGNKQLSTPSLPLLDFMPTSRSYSALLTLVQDMKETMAAKGGVGIAAPQIGINQRVIIFGFDHNSRYPEEPPVPFTVLINPEYQILDEEKIEGWEGCLSVPGLRGLVSRYKKITYSGYDLQGNLVRRRAEGFHARIIQHECDHLDGILYPQRLHDLRYLGYEDELAEITR